jgi:hypothetical protein
VLIKIRRYKQKHGENTAETQNSILDRLKTSSAADLMIAALQLLMIFPIVSLFYVLNKTGLEDLGKFPLYQAVQIHTHYLLFCVIGFRVASYYKSNAKLRQAVFREILEFKNRFF